MCRKLAGLPVNFENADLVDSDAFIRISHLTHAYPATRRKPSRTALQDVTLEISPGEMVAFLGPNGSGKTTLLRSLTTSLCPNGGTIQVGPSQLPRDAGKVRMSLGVVFQKPALDTKMTVVENLRAAARLHRVQSKEIDPRIQFWLGEMDVADRGNDLVGNLSGGLARRVELAKALIHEPALLVLDEPTSGLDPVSRHDFWQRIGTLRQEREMTVVLTTHQIDEASRSDRAAILHRGRLLAFDTPAKLQSRIGRQVLSITAQDPDVLKVDLHDQFGIDGTIVGNMLRFELESSLSLDDLLSLFGDRFDSLNISPPSLEDVFFHFAGELLTNLEEVAA